VSRIAVATFSDDTDDSYLAAQYNSEVLELPIDQHSQPTHPTGTPRETLGSINLTWSFKNDPNEFYTKFYVTPSDPKKPFDVILGRLYLNPEQPPPLTLKDGTGPDGSQGFKRWWLVIVQKVVKPFIHSLLFWHPNESKGRKEKAQ